MRIGRDPEGEVVIAEDPTVSRRHAVIRAQAQGWVIEDAGSLNGTWVNGARIAQTTLEPGQLVQVGRSLLRVEIG